MFAPALGVTVAELIRMPEVLAGATEAAIEAWLVEAGSSVTLEQVIAEIETDKATVELNAESAGTVGRLLVAEGVSVAVGDPILVLVADGEGEAEVDAALAESGSPDAANEPTASPGAEPAREATAREVPQAPTQQPSAQQAATPHDETSRGERMFASPIVRKRAAENGVSLSDITGTGPRGRIVRRDLEQHLQQGSDAASTVSSPVRSGDTPSVGSATGGSPTEFEDIPLSRMRKAIARRLAESKSTVPHFYLVAECRVDALMELRRNANRRAERKVSVNDFIVKAVAGALTEVSAANATWNGDSIRQFHSVDIAVAVAIDDGLITPVLRGVERMTLTEVSANIAQLAERGRRGELKQNELEGGSFAVSNLGMYGTKEFSAIINPPQSGILAVGAAHAAPVVDEGGDLVVGQVMTVTLSADHRVLDGAVAAQWLAAFQYRVENPLSILI